MRPPGSEMERMQRWAADREAVLEAKLTGMKAGLKLTADQEKLWGRFEAASGPHRRRASQPCRT